MLDRHWTWPRNPRRSVKWNMLLLIAMSRASSTSQASCGHDREVISSNEAQLPETGAFSRCCSSRACVRFIARIIQVVQKVFMRARQARKKHYLDLSRLGFRRPDQAGAFPMYLSIMELQELIVRTRIDCKQKKKKVDISSHLLEKVSIHPSLSL